MANKNVKSERNWAEISMKIAHCEVG